MSMRHYISVAAVAFLTAAAPAAEPLGVGDPAPALRVKEFVKGEPVKALASGTIYVVEFWATWCTACRQSIPHTTSLQKKHPAIVIIGVSVGEDDFGLVRPFVARMGDKMNYRVAIDDVPTGKSADEGAMKTAWLDAADTTGLPTAFIVGKDGRIAWIGDPRDMDAALAGVVAGTWDVGAAAAAYKLDKARDNAVSTALAKVKRATKEDDLKGAITVLDRLVAGDPKTEPLVGRLKFQLLCDTGEPERAATYGRRLVDNVFHDNVRMLDALAWSVVAPEAVKGKKPDEPLVRVAIAAAERAVALTRRADAEYLGTLAQARFVAGDVAPAIELAEQALRLQPDHEELKQLLAAMRKAKERSNNPPNPPAPFPKREGGEN
jgi:thiol-disulfide isomerase/thioredoxin